MCYPTFKMGNVKCSILYVYPVVTTLSIPLSDGHALRLRDLAAYNNLNAGPSSRAV